MTTEKAIRLLRRLQDEQFDGINGDERREALEMAVRALKQNLVKESGDLVQDLVKDCISRQQAIDAVVSAMIDGADAELVEGVMELLPSAQPERNGWVHIDDIYRLISGHSNYHGDNILAALTCLAEGKDVPNPITVLEPLERKTGKWIWFARESGKEKR